MTIFYPDISGFQKGIDLNKAIAVCAKATQGTTYVSSDFARQKANAASHNTFFFAYHFLEAGNASAQASHCFATVGKTPLMLDVEVTGASHPSIGDAIAFVDAYRKLGGTLFMLYLPHWYWQQIGTPSLKPFVDRHCHLVSSEYTKYTDADSGIGWQPYGGMTPAAWQYTDRLNFNGHTVDFNAFRGNFAGKQDAASTHACLQEFKALISGISPSPPFVHAKGKRLLLVTYDTHPNQGADNWNAKVASEDPGNFQPGSIDHYARAEIGISTKDPHNYYIRGLPFKPVPK